MGDRRFFDQPFVLAAQACDLGLESLGLCGPGRGGLKVAFGGPPLIQNGHRQSLIGHRAPGDSTRCPHGRQLPPTRAMRRRVTGRPGRVSQRDGASVDIPRRECVRVSDTVSRQGGDEFVVLLSEAEQWEDADIVARRMLAAVSEAHLIDLRDLHITASIGVSVYPDDGADAETLIKNADTAMYQAKENGRQGYQFFKPAMNVRAVERQSIEEGLRRALERDEFVLHYQPKVDLITGAITGAEALVRWMHPTRGLVPPAQFIPIAEDSGMILPIGNWVLREACTQAKAWQDAGLPVTTMAVNVSAMQLRDENFLEDLFTILRETGLDPRSLELELTESVLMKQADSAAAILQILRERGVQVAVDDFGTGYSSLSYLRRFPIDALKIDQSFVSHITVAGDDTSIVTAVISMARSLKLRVVAEGVETSEQLAFLREYECDEAQGYLFSRPVPPQQFARLLRRKPALLLPMASRSAS